MHQDASAAVLGELFRGQAEGRPLKDALPFHISHQLSGSAARCVQRPTRTSFFQKMLWVSKNPIDLRSSFGSAAAPS